jgi:hypothetical protein
VCFQRVQAVEYTVVEELLAQFIPHVLLRVEFRRIGRQKQGSHIFRQFDFLAFMPAFAVKHHDNILIRVAWGNFIQKHLHACAIDVGQYQRIEASLRLSAESAIGFRYSTGKGGIGKTVSASYKLADILIAEARAEQIAECAGVLALDLAHCQARHGDWLWRRH